MRLLVCVGVGGWVGVSVFSVCVCVRVCVRVCGCFLGLLLGLRAAALCVLPWFVLVHVY